MSTTETLTTNPYLTGNFAPVDEEVTLADLPVEGTIPPDLNGRLLRIGPNPVGEIDAAKYHWFTGDGMVHGLRLRDGKAEWYRNRHVRSDRVVEVKGGPPVTGPRHGMGDGANTNVIGHGGRTWAIVEAGSLPVELTFDLETVARSNFDGTLPGSFTAHPKRDPITGELHAVVYYWDWDHVEYVVVGTDARVRKVVDVPVPGKPMVHDCAITESSVLLFDLPVTFNMEAAMTGAVFPYQWNPDYGARVGVLPREGEAGDVRWCEVDLCYVYHPLNAYDMADGRVVVDVVRHPRMFATDLRGPNEGQPYLERWTLDPAKGTTVTEPLSDRPLEFPRHDERLVGRQHRFGYTTGFTSKGRDGIEAGPIFKHDLDRGTTEVHDFGPGGMSMEPVFVPTSPAAAEDDGWVMVYVHDAARNGCDVHILHSQDFAGRPVATVHLPVRVPFGFHGNWVAEV